MSKSHSCLTPSPTHPYHPAPPDLAALADALQEAARALLDLQATAAPGAAREPADKPPARRDDGETRAFFFPRKTVHQERELLLKYRKDNFLGLLEEVHLQLAGLVKIMQSVHKDVRVRGYVIASLGAQLEHASCLVLRMRDVYDKVMPVQSPA